MSENTRKTELLAGYKTYLRTSPGYSFKEFVAQVEQDFGGSLEGLTFGVTYFSGEMMIERKTSIPAPLPQTA